MARFRCKYTGDEYDDSGCGICPDCPGAMDDGIYSEEENCDESENNA